MRTTTFTKENTLVIKAIGVMLMVLYHLLRTPYILDGFSVNYFPFQTNIFYEPLEYGYFCVSIFLFLSMFGMTRKVMQLKEELTGKGYFWFATRRYIKLILFFAPIYITSILIFMKVRPISSIYGEGKKVPFYMVIDMLGIRQIFGTPSYNMTWWFLQVAIWAIVLFPILMLLYQKISYLIFPFVILVSYSFQINGYLSEEINKYLLIFCLGICFAKENVLERMKEKKIIENKFGNKMIKLFLWSICFVLFAFILCIKYLLNDIISFYIEGIIVVLLIYFIYEFLCGIKWVEAVLKPIGKHSATIFYFHSFLFVWIEFTKKILFKLEYIILIYFVAIIISMVYSILLNQLKKVTYYNKMAGKITLFFENNMNKLQAKESEMK